MIKNCWFVLGALLSTSLLAQQSTNTPTPAPDQAAAASTNAVVATDTNAPVAKAEKKKSSKKKREKTNAQKEAAQLKTVPLVAGPATVIASNVNVRGLAGLKGEVLTRVNKGQGVTVLEEITLKKSAPDEPSAWAKILLPQGAHTWVSSAYIDPTNKTVLPKKLKIRAGPGENYSMLGILERGDAVKEVTTKGEWTEIEPPPTAYAFVAAQYLQQEAPGTVAATQEATPTPVTETPAVAAAPTEAPSTPTPPPLTNAPAETAAATTTPPTEPPAEEELPKRIVQHEGVVRGTFSIQAPTHFELVSPESGKTINYLYTTSPLLDLQRYKGLRIVVTGEEGLDERWRNTPVITIQKIQVVE
jgi:uncharacterized protein YgiM (DUF1202 family)